MGAIANAVHRANPDWAAQEKAPSSQETIWAVVCAAWGANPGQMNANEFPLPAFLQRASQCLFCEKLQCWLRSVQQGEDDLNRFSSLPDASGTTLYGFSPARENTAKE
jgi:hypothetical protein